MYDGDEDRRDRPDIGSVFGQLADEFNKDTGVIAIAAQTKSWYSPPSTDAPISSANGTPFETYVFSDELEGAHKSLTQSVQLVKYPNYSQVFVGPVGQIGLEQLHDVSDKAVLYRDPNLPGVKVEVFITPNNPDVDTDLASKLEAAKDNPDLTEKIRAKIEQRQNRYGLLCTPQGFFGVPLAEFPGIAFSVGSFNQYSNLKAES